MPPPKLTDAQWEAIRQEWEAGSLSVALLAKQYGVSRQAIMKRARTEAWPTRPEQGLVTAQVTSSIKAVTPVTNVESTRVMLTSFHRVMLLLLRHRKLIAQLSAEWEDLFEMLSVVKERLRNQKRGVHQGATLDDLESVANILTKASIALAKIVPLERQAFGLTDKDGPSEFDQLTDEQIEALDRHVRKVLGE
jgi:hypothetical protein